MPQIRKALLILLLLPLCGAPALAQISVALDTPSGGESWEAGSTHNITWESGGTPDSVNLYYSIDNGASYDEIAIGQADSHSYPWPVPLATATTEAKVKIEAVKAAELVTDESAAPFTIYIDSEPPVVAVVTPGGGEAWQGSAVNNIVFTATDESGIKTDSLYVWYSTDNGLSYPNQVTADAAAVSPYAWTTPALSTTEVRIRVSVKDNSVLANPGTDESNAKFTIDSTPPAVTVSQPNGGETLYGGTSYEVKWVPATDNFGLAADPITLRYSQDGGYNWTPIAAGEANDGSYFWTVPALDNPLCRVSAEARDAAGLVGSDMSNANFTITPDVTGPSVTIDAPVGGEKWRGGTVHQITFEASDISGILPNSLTVWYSTSNGLTYPNLVTSGASSVSPYNWALPSNVSTTEVRVRITLLDASVNQNPGTAECTAKFTIDSTPPVVTVSQPNGGESLTGGGTYEVRWVNATDECGLAANPITLRYSQDGGYNWTPIAAGEANDGSYIWTVPAISNPLCRVSVEALNAAGLAGSDMSNANFTIALDTTGPSVTIDAPAGGEKWRGGTVHLITFEASDPSGIAPNSLTVWYSTDNGLTYPNLATSGASSVSPYNWTLPSNVSTTEARVRITLLDASVNQNPGTAECAAKFMIDSTPPVVTVTFPNGGENLSGNTPYSVQWSASDECGLVSQTVLRYSTSSGESWTEIITGQASSGSYTWTTPYINSAAVRVSAEVQNQVGLIGTGMSSANFTISSDLTAPAVTVDAPAGGEKWRGGAVHLITFEASDPSGIKANSLSVWYSTDNGLTYPDLITSDASSVSPYNWTVPSITSTEVKVRVTLKDNSYGQNPGTAECAAKFTIDSLTPVVTVDAPAGGEKWQGGVSHYITWEASDNYNLRAGPISLFYSTNEGTAWFSIVSNLANSGSYNWPVPAVSTTEMRVRVVATDEAGNTGTAASAANFTVVATAPAAPAPLTQLNGTATGDATPYFSWSAPADVSGIVSYEITVDTAVTTQGAAANYTPGAALPDGYHTWEVRAKDGVGWWGSACAPQQFLIMTTTPEVSALALKDRFTGSLSYAKDRQVTLEAAGTDATAAQMMISESAVFAGASWRTFQNPATFEVAASQGQKTVYYKVRDVANNESPVVTGTITLDTFVPSVTVVDPNGGENLGGGLSYTVRWSASDSGTGLTASPITVRLSSNGGTTWSPVASNEVNDGVYSWVVPAGIDSTTCLISIEAVDLAGNVWYDKSDANFTIVSLGPQTPTLLSPADGGYVNSATPQLQWSANTDAVSYECTIDGAVSATVSANTYTPASALTEGAHTWSVRAKNAADLWSGPSGSDTFTVDVTAPAVTLNVLTDNTDPSPTLTGQAGDNYKVASVEVRLDGGSWQPAAASDGSFSSSQETFSLAASSLAQGMHTLEARACDAAGNVTAASAYAALSFLITRSTVTFSVQMAGVNVSAGTVIPYRPTFRVSVSAPLPVVDLKVYIDSQSVYAHTGSFTAETVDIAPFQDLAVGSHALLISALNSAGDTFTHEVTGLTVISDVRVSVATAAKTITLAVNTSSGGPATLIIRKANGQTVLQKQIPDLADAGQITLDKYIAGENLKGPYLWKLIYNSGRSSKSGGFIVP
ncbi:MAG: hypothetical protein JW873_04220 [Candidatus Saganbacteria bacterium]|nr:hypothetical protein [Candidatus Saganbacteria bacterium]